MSTKVPFTERKYILTLVFVTSLFLLWGIAITMGDVLNKHFQNVLHISKSRSALVQFSLFGAYAVMGIPAGLFMKRFGYKNGVLLGLFLYSAGAFLFIPSANAQSFDFFRIALFVLACGLATLETVAHPFMAALGDQRTSDQRLNFAQSFNGVGAVVGPAIGSYFILRASNVHTGDVLYSVKALYVCIGTVIAIIAIAFSLVKVPELAGHHDLRETEILPQSNFTLMNAPSKGGQMQTSLPTNNNFIANLRVLFGYNHFRWAVAAQFFNVAAQGGTWAYFINYGHEKMGLTDEHAGYFFSLSMLGMMAGRFLGTFLMRYIAPNKLLAAFAFANIIMCIIVAQSFGWVSFAALIMLNFFFSIMYPTIFSLGLKDLGPYTQQASSFIVMGVAGGALFPPVMGLIANHDIAAAYYLPIICYAVIFLFGYKYYRVNNLPGSTVQSEKPVTMETYAD